MSDDVPMPERLWADRTTEGLRSYKNTPFGIWWWNRRDGYVEYVRADIAAAEVLRLRETEAALRAEVARLRDGIAYVLNKHPYGRLKALMGALLRGETPAGFAGSESRWEDRVTSAESRAYNAELKLKAIIDAHDRARAALGDKEASHDR